jgi:light-regulated signal transduction histidine kinase (bacteriophytochrome)
MAERREVYGLRKDGSEFPAEAGISRVLIGDRTLLMAVLEDVSDRRRHEDAVQALNEDLERRVGERTAELETATRELEAFSYSVSHDLRAPLRAINGFSQILIEEYAAQLPAEAHRYLDIVRSNAQRMGRLVDDLLAFSRLRNAQLNREPLDLAAIAREVIGEIERDITDREIRFTIGELPVADGDRALLRQVLLNLVGNALKFTRPRPVVEIEVGAKDADGEHVYFVRDNGVGFDMEYAGKMFGVFQRLHRDDEFEGTGVGLAIVHNIITRHGGRVWANALPDHGATVYFTLGGMSA